MRARDRLVDQHCRLVELVDPTTSSRGYIVPSEPVPAVQRIVDLPVIYPPGRAEGPRPH
jgi:hypothetical protein